MEIKIEILQQLGAGITEPTHLMSATEINHSKLRDALKRMVKGGFVEQADAAEPDRQRRKNRPTTKTFHLTSKGQNVVNYYRGFDIEDNDAASKTPRFPEDSDSNQKNDRERLLR